jgi:hypothetical protein
MTTARRATPIPTFCAVCRRHAVWLGYAPCKPERQPVIWLCGEEYCHAAAARTYTMPGPMLDAYELAAMLEAGTLAAEYLEQLNQTDLAKLNREQWREFLRRLLTSYEHVLRRKILSDEPAF